MKPILWAFLKLDGTRVQQSGTQPCFERDPCGYLRPSTAVLQSKVTSPRLAAVSRCETTASNKRIANLALFLSSNDCLHAIRTRANRQVGHLHTIYTLEIYKPLEYTNERSLATSIHRLLATVAMSSIHRVLHL